VGGAKAEVWPTFRDFWSRALSVVVTENHLTQFCKKRGLDHSCDRDTSVKLQVFLDGPVPCLSLAREQVL